MTLEIKALRVVSLLPFIHERKSFDQIVELFKRHGCIFQFLGALQLRIDYLKIYRMYSLTNSIDKKKKTLSLSLSMLMYLTNNPNNNWSWNKKTATWKETENSEWWPVQSFHFRNVQWHLLCAALTHFADIAEFFIKLTHYLLWYSFLQDSRYMQWKI